MPTGRISRVSYQHGFGIIEPDDGGPEVFVDFRELEDDAFPTVGIRLTYVLGPPSGRPYAVNVKQTAD